MNDDIADSPVAGLPRVQRVSAVLWPSFVLAGLANVVFFALIDPVEVLDCHGVPPLSRTAAYSLGFFAFWLLTAASSLATRYYLGTHVPPPRRVEIADDE